MPDVDVNVEIENLKTQCVSLLNKCTPKSGPQAAMAFDMTTIVAILQMLLKLLELLNPKQPEPTGIDE